MDLLPRPGTRGDHRVRGPRSRRRGRHNPEGQGTTCAERGRGRRGRNLGRRARRYAGVVLRSVAPRGSPRHARPGGGRRARPRPHGPPRSAAGAWPIGERFGQRVSSSGSTRTPASGVDELGRSATRVATTGRPQAIASSSAWPNGSTRLGWQRTSRPRGSCESRRAGRGPARVTPVLPSSSPAAAPRRRRSGSPRRAVRRRRARRTTFLRWVRAPTQRYAGPLPSSGRAGSSGKRARSTPQSTTSVLPRASGILASSSRRRKSETATTAAARRTTARVASFDTGDRADVADVLAVRGDDERRPRGESADQPGRNEEVRVDDVGSEPPGGRECVSRQEPA